ncbi:hypothetical protein PAXRUDRAFT_58776, partial [Paxillus rubicundulus Ve08.2h10]
LKFWEGLWEKCASVAQMALDYFSAPASSTDTKRAFSDGHRELNFMQHNTSS